MTESDPSAIAVGPVAQPLIEVPSSAEVLLDEADDSIEGVRGMSGQHVIAGGPGGARKPRDDLRADGRTVREVPCGRGLGPPIAE